MGKSKAKAILILAHPDIIRHIQELFRHIQNPVQHWHIENRSISRTLTYSEPKAYSEPRYT